MLSNKIYVFKKNIEQSHILDETEKLSTTNVNVILVLCCVLYVPLHPVLCHFLAKRVNVSFFVSISVFSVFSVHCGPLVYRFIAPKSCITLCWWLTVVMLKLKWFVMHR